MQLDIGMAGLRLGRPAQGLFGARLDETVRPPSAQQLTGHRRAQALGHACAEWVARALKEGVTEIEASERLGKYLQVHGAGGWFHRPYACFGERTGAGGCSRQRFRPSARRLREGEPMILAVAPILDGYIGDISRTTSIGPCPELVQAQDFLRRLRAWLPRLFSGDLPIDELWAAIDRRIREAGYHNCHAPHLQGALGRRISRRGPGGLHGHVPVRCGMHPVFAFLRRGVNQEVLGPDCTTRKEGLWIIEPHIAWADGGAKFEEMLVVERGRARWLDDNVPLTRVATGAS